MCSASDAAADKSVDRCVAEGLRRRGLHQVAVVELGEGVADGLRSRLSELATPGVNPEKL